MLGLCCCVGFALVVEIRGFSCEAQTLVGCTDFSSCSVWALVHRLHSCRHGLRRSAECGIFSDQWSNLCLLLWQVGSLPLSHQGSPQKDISISLIKKRHLQPPWPQKWHWSGPWLRTGLWNVPWPRKWIGSWRSIGFRYRIGHGECHELMKDREAWHAAVHEVAKSWTLLSNWRTTTKEVVMAWILEGVKDMEGAMTRDIKWITDKATKEN